MTPGLEVGDVDGIASTGQADALDVMQGLGLDGVNFYGGALGGGVGPSVVANAALAVAGGVCDTALAYVTMTAPRPGAGTYNYMGGRRGRRQQRVHDPVRPGCVHAVFRALLPTAPAARWRNRRTDGRLRRGHARQRLTQPPRRPQRPDHHAGLHRRPASSPSRFGCSTATCPSTSAVPWSLPPPIGRRTSSTSRST